MKKTFLMPVLMLLLITSSGAQKIDSVLNILITQHPVEKIYIHYDKEYYVAGETIWFKAYLYGDGKPAAISTNLYLQFINSKGHAIFNKHYPALGAVVKGNIDLPDSLSQGNYYIRAYTAGMLNYDKDFIYTKNIFVHNPFTKNTHSEKLDPQNVSLQFFPESGNMVDGILSVAGFKATDQWGGPVEVNGIIKTDDGATIASFKSYHDGIGKVQFKPQAGKKYMAEVETVSGARTFLLPAVQPSGINLKIQDEKGGKKFQLSRSEKDKAQFDNLLLVVQINNHIVYKNEIAFEDYSSVIGHLVTDSLPSGILHFTVFNKDGMPLAERLTFVDNGEYRGKDEISVLKTSPEKRAENIFEINFSDSIKRSLSVSVIDFSRVDIKDQENIWSRFLLTSDLKGYIYNPAWYFTNQNDTTRRALDNLMLTHGWSRFNWTKILNRQFPEKKYATTYLLNISGIIYSEKDKKPVEGGKLNVFLSAEDSSLYTYDIPVNEKGQFLIDSLAIAGKIKIYYIYTDKGGKERQVTIKTDDNMLPGSFMEFFPGSFAKYPGVEFQDSKKPDIARRVEFVKNGNPDAKLLENVTVTAKQKRPIDIINEEYTSDMFSTGGKIKIDNINFPPVDKAMNGVDFVLNRIPTLGVQGDTFVNRKNFSLKDNKPPRRPRIGGPRTTVSGPMRYWEVGLFINEVPADIVVLQSLRADQIAIVKFFEAGAMVAGSAYPGGAIAVYVNYGTGITNELPKSKYIEYNGYSISKEFYSPDYSVPGTNSNRSDNRSTLYWDPEIFKESQSGNVQLKFFNNDYSKQFKIVVEGFDATGKLIHIEKIIGD